jgi:hypothetical protein
MNFLSRRRLFLSLAVLVATLILGVVLFLRWRDRPSPPMARIMISTADEAGETFSFPPLTEIFSDIQIFQRTISQLSPSLSPPEILNKAEDLKKHTHLQTEEETNILQIVVSYPNRKQAADEANALVQTLEKFYQSEAVKSSNGKIQNLQQEEAERRGRLDQLQKKIKSLDVDAEVFARTKASFEKDLLLKERQRDILMETYTEQHPEVAKLIKQIEKLQREMPQESEDPASDLHLARGQYDTEMKQLEESREKMNQIAFIKQKTGSPLKIMSYASALTPNRKTDKLFLLLAIAALLLILGWVLYSLKTQGDYFS